MDELRLPRYARPPLFVAGLLVVSMVLLVLALALLVFSSILPLVVFCCVRLLDLPRQGHFDELATLLRLACEGLRLTQVNAGVVGVSVVADHWQ